MVDGRVDVPGLLGSGVGAGPVPLLLHETAEFRLVHREPLLGGHLQGEVDGEAVGVVEGEGVLAGDDPVPLRGCGGGEVEDLGAGGQSAPEGRLLLARHLEDLVGVGLQLRVGLGHGVLGDRHESGEHRLVHAQEADGAHGPPDEPPQDVSAAVVAWAYAVADEHEGRADVVGHHAHAHVVLGVGPVFLPGDLLGRRDDGEDLVDLVHVGFALEEVGDALQAGAGVDGGLVELADQFEVVALSLAPDELVEDEVPDLQEAVPLRVGGRASVRAVGGAAVVVDLAAGAGRPGLAGGPGDVLEGELLDVVGRQADDAGPVVVGDLVLLPDGHPQAVAVEPVAAFGDGRGQQAPGQVDGALLEVVPEGEVAVHLEEGAVAGRLAHVVDVVGADALLHRGGPGPRSRLGAQDVGDEGNHAGDREEDRRVGRDERHRRSDMVVVLLEVVEPASTDLSGTHIFCVP